MPKKEKSNHLKQILGEVVENQIRDEECVFVADAYEELMDFGYSERQAKEKIASVLLENMYDILSGNTEYDEAAYRQAIEEMLEEVFRDGDKWDNELYADESDVWRGIKKLLDTGQHYYNENDMEKCLESWEPVWVRVKENAAGAYKKPELCDLDEATDFEYGFEEWAYRMATAYLAARRFDEAVRFCEEVKETFAWETMLPVEFDADIGKAYDLSGQKEKSDAWFEEWLKNEPDNFKCVCKCALHWAGRGDNERGGMLIEDALKDKECNYVTQDWFLQAASFFTVIGNKEKAEYYRKIYDDFFQKFLKDPTAYGPQDEWGDGGLFFGDDIEKQQPLVKGKKIYPNDPCPCGSGKKYKKCCGRK